MTSRDKRQELCVSNWIVNKCKGLIIAKTGFGKTRIAMIAIKKFLKKNLSGNIMIVVPNEALERQWKNLLLENGIIAEVVIINTVIRHNWKTDFLILDEIHMMASELNIDVFNRVKYKMVLGLTATIKRLDGREELILEHCPIVDEVTSEECLENNWISEHKEYKVLIDVNLDEYNDANKHFLGFFSFFNYDFNLAMKCVTNFRYREILAKGLTNRSSDFQESLKIVNANSFGFLKALKFRKKFVQEHPKKIELANLIIEHRMDKKIITFSSTIKMAEKIKYGNSLNSGMTKKKRSITLDEFKSVKTGVLNSSKALNAGVDIEHLNTAIILTNSSSNIEKKQRVGRVIRLEGSDKIAEVFTFVIKGTMEESWFSKSTGNDAHIIIDEENLLRFLKGELYEELRNVSKTNPILRF